MTIKWLTIWGKNSVLSERLLLFQTHRYESSVHLHDIFATNHCQMLQSDIIGVRAWLIHYIRGRYKKFWGHYLIWCITTYHHGSTLLGEKADYHILWLTFYSIVSRYIAVISSIEICFSQRPSSGSRHFGAWSLKNHPSPAYFRMDQKQGYRPLGF